MPQSPTRSPTVSPPDRQSFGGVGQIRTALAFDLSAIPAGSQINSVTLLLKVNSTGNGTISGLGTIEIREAVPNGVAANNMVENQVSFSEWKTGSTWTTTGSNFARFGSDDAVTATNRPLLTIDYTAPTPEPTTASLVVLGSLALLARRRSFTTASAH